MKIAAAPTSNKDLKTLAECMESLKEQGFSDNFMAKENGLYDVDTKKTYTSQEIKIANFFRFEGASDPGDSSILYALEAEDGTKGLLSDSYGPSSDTRVTKFIADVEEINKKTSADEKL